MRFPFDEVERHLAVIASHHRRTCGEGEAAARAYIADVLGNAGVNVRRLRHKVLLGLPGRGTLHYADGAEIPCRVWGFSPSTDGAIREGRAAWVPENGFGANPLVFMAERSLPRERDLDGTVVVTESSSPLAVLEAQARGAVAFVIRWPYGDERQIHKSGICLPWGIPLPEEMPLLTGIPVIAINRADGIELESRMRTGDVRLRFSVEAERGVREIEQIEATIPSTEDDPRFLLAGSHLDAKHYGATDNATGCALTLALALHTASLPRRRYGLRVCWWSGHEYGKYAGSSAYASLHFLDLYRNCIATVNADMPGLRGAMDFSRITAGPDFLALAQKVVRDVTGQTGRWPDPVRAWDQSFQNMGLSTLFAWGSTLPGSSPDRTGKGFMSWWWHTEDDLLQYHDPAILATDAEVYARATEALVSGDDPSPDVAALFGFLLDRLTSACGRYARIADLRGVLGEYRDLASLWGGLPSPERPVGLRLAVVRKLNQALYVRCPAYGQDPGCAQGWLPGIVMAGDPLLDWKGSAEGRLVLEGYVGSQINRLCSLAEDIRHILGNP